MSAQASIIKSTIEFTRNGATVFSGIGSIISAEKRVLGSRVGLGFSVMVGMCKVTNAVPGLTKGTLTIEQSVDATNWEVTNSFSLITGDGNFPFGVPVVAKFIRARFGVPATETMDIRFGAALRVVE